MFAYWRNFQETSFALTFPNTFNTINSKWFWYITITNYPISDETKNGVQNRFDIPRNYLSLTLPICFITKEALIFLHYLFSLLSKYDTRFPVILWYHNMMSQMTWTIAANQKLRSYDGNRVHWNLNSERLKTV